jgi:hypothetical protein
MTERRPAGSRGPARRRYGAEGREKEMLQRVTPHFLTFMGEVYFLYIFEKKHF